MLTVRVGSNNATAGGRVYRVTDIFFHPNYKPNTLEFNVAVVKLHKNITIKSERNVDVIGHSREKLIPTDTEVTFLGWGSVWVSTWVINWHVEQKKTLNSNVPNQIHKTHKLTICKEVMLGRN